MQPHSEKFKGTLSTLDVVDIPRTSPYSEPCPFLSTFVNRRQILCSKGDICHHEISPSHLRWATSPHATARDARIAGLKNLAPRSTQLQP